VKEHIKKIKAFLRKKGIKVNADISKILCFFTEYDFYYLRPPRVNKIHWAAVQLSYHVEVEESKIEDILEKLEGLNLLSEGKTSRHKKEYGFTVEARRITKE
jgi:hypothetical protein